MPSFHPDEHKMYLEPPMQVESAINWNILYRYFCFNSWLVSGPFQFMCLWEMEAFQPDQFFNAFTKNSAEVRMEWQGGVKFIKSWLDES